MKTLVVLPKLDERYKIIFSELNKYSEIIYASTSNALELFLLESPEVILCFSEPIKEIEVIDGKWKNLAEIFNDLKFSVVPGQTLIRLAFMKQEDMSENYLRLPFSPEELIDCLCELKVLTI